VIRIEFEQMEHDGVLFTQIGLHADPEDLETHEGRAAFLMALKVYRELESSSPVGVPVPTNASDEGKDHLAGEMVERARRLADLLGLDPSTMRPKEDAHGD
jgi:hypothetical protein